MKTTTGAAGGNISYLAISAFPESEDVQSYSSNIARPHAAMSLQDHDSKEAWWPEHLHYEVHTPKQVKISRNSRLHKVAHIGKLRPGSF